MTPALRVCVVYDCLHPWTVGGQERWLRSLAETAARAGHDVTYLTRRQWGEELPQVPGVRVVAVSPRQALYGPGGNRRTLPPLLFALGVGGHLLRRRGRYDVVHTCGFPFFHLPAIRAALAGTGTRVLVDWIEVWSPQYWRDYVGGIGGRVGAAVQALCIRLTPTALAYSDLHAGRLAASGLRRPALRPGGLGPDPVGEPAAGGVPDPPVVAFAGRHIREKRAVVAVQAVAAARELPGLTGLTLVLLGDGPQRPGALAQVTALGLQDAVSAPGFVPAAELATVLGTATCLLHPSSREGFGIVVLEAAAQGTPVVLVAGPDNAAAELVVPGVNGEIASEPSPAAVASAVARVHAGGAALRASTARWYADNAEHLSARSTAEQVLGLYTRPD